MSNIIEIYKNAVKSNYSSFKDIEKGTYTILENFIKDTEYGETVAVKIVYDDDELCLFLPKRISGRLIKHVRNNPESHPKKLIYKGIDKKTNAFLIDFE